MILFNIVTSDHHSLTKTLSLMIILSAFLSMYMCWYWWECVWITQSDFSLYLVNKDYEICFPFEYLFAFQTKLVSTCNFRRENRCNRFFYIFIHVSVVVCRCAARAMNKVTCSTTHAHALRQYERGVQGNFVDWKLIYKPTRTFYFYIYI